MSRFELFRTQTETNYAELSPYTHTYLLRRPRTHEPVDEVVGSGEEEAQIDDPVRERRRLELFIDLIWVGIIGNLAEHFADQAYSPETVYSIGRAIWEFLILFLLAWRLWKFLQDYMGKYRTNDIIERIFVVWALVLAVGYGNNAPYLFEEKNSGIAMTFYLVFKGSILTVETYYSLHLPHLRRRVILQAILGFPVLGLWLPAYWQVYPTKAALVYCAVVLEFWGAAVIETPLAERFLKDDRKEIFNRGHWVERLQDFYIIILGEGVLNLIRGSPLGEGITTKAGMGVDSLWVFYVLSCLFFNGDSSRRYIHAVRRTWWRRILWLSCHVSMFGSTLILGVTLSFFIDHLRTNAIDPSHGEDEELHKLARTMYSAKWVASTTLSVVLFNQTKIALLNRSLDGPRTLKVNNRYLRLLPRILVAVVILCLPIDRRMSAATYLGIVVAVLIPCLLWEWTANLDAGGGLVEPKYMSKTMSGSRK